jgi:hypothetical protein
MTEPTTPEEPKTFPEEYVKELREENARRRLAEKTLRDQLTQVRAALGVLEDEAADPVKAAETLRSRSDADRKLVTETLVRAEFERTSAEFGIVDADAAFRLADVSAVRVDLESRKVLGLREVLETLVRERPFLVGRASRAGSPGGGTPRASGKPDDDSLGGRIRKQFERRMPAGMSVPGASVGGLRIR